MAARWPFTKKSAEPPRVIKAAKRKIVEYERKKDDGSKQKISDRSHLENDSFKEAMDLLGEDSKES